MGAEQKKNGRMKIETTKMSSRGQIVIPQDIRDMLKADEGTVFAIAGSGNTLILRKLETPSEDSLLKDIDKMNSNEYKRGDEK